MLGKLVCFDEAAVYCRDTTTRAALRVGRDLGLAVDVPDYTALPLYEEKEECVLFIHAAFLKLTGTTVRGLRQRCPCAKIITLGSDTAHYLPGLEFDTPLEADLHLDTMEDDADQLSKKEGRAGNRLGLWSWTFSGDVWEELEKNKKSFSSSERLTEANCLITVGPYNEPRQEMKKVFQRRGFSCSFGGGLLLDREQAYRAMASSWVTIGTTSPSWTRGRTCKGWRDFAGVACGAPLIYDRHPDTVRLFGGEDGGLVPFYPYGDWDACVDLARALIADPERYARTLARQREWLAHNTIECQLKGVLSALCPGQFLQEAAPVPSLALLPVKTATP